MDKKKVRIIFTICSCIRKTNNLWQSELKMNFNCSPHLFSFTWHYVECQVAFVHSLLHINWWIRFVSCRIRLSLLFNLAPHHFLQLVNYSGSRFTAAVNPNHWLNTSRTKCQVKMADQRCNWQLLLNLKLYVTCNYAALHYSIYAHHKPWYQLMGRTHYGTPHLRWPYKNSVVWTYNLSSLFFMFLKISCAHQGM